ncbi:cupin domain-containing protein [Hymenobacter fodinae]|uniref:Cupin domain-containing protein n=1 Tax=Hymenobacter fodinae TaxID=2510796 RepID=A0A4Z0NZX1_9BACT|nr:cupin domain-containing protein [Hymenobacter fodinae]TGE03706.1 cupin domain-containing protein [Hymenobacter fodinae]
MKSQLWITALTGVAVGLLSGYTLCGAAARATPPVQHFAFASLPIRAVNALTTRSMVSGQAGTIGRLVYRKGAVIPRHQHPNEQYSLILQGSVRVSIDGQTYLVKAGEGLVIPPNVPHRFEALEDGTVDVDFFTPRRQDWIDGTDTYSAGPGK